MTRSSDFPIARSPDRLMFWRLWWRAVSVKRSQTMVALGSLAVGAAITSMLLNLYGDVRRKMTEDFRSYGPNVVIAPASAGVPAGDDQEGGTMMEEAALQPVAQFVHGTPGALLAPVLYGVVRVSPSTADPRFPESANVVAAGAEFGAWRGLNPGWRLVGETDSGDLPPGHCALGSHLAARMHLRLGDGIEVHRVFPATAVAERGEAGNRRAPPETGVASYRIATLVTTGASEDDQVFLPLAALQSILGITGKVTLAEVRIPGETRDVERAVHQMASLAPSLEVHPIRQIVYSEGKVLGTIRWLLLSLTILIVIIIALCVMATMTAIVLERRRDIGVMKALGAADGLLMRLFLTESATLGLVGGVCGFGVGALLASGVAEQLFGVSLSVSAWTLPAVCGFTVALAVLAAQIPVRVVRAIQPNMVLKGE